VLSDAQTHLIARLEPQRIDLRGETETAICSIEDMPSALMAV
jgi:hypothetical protein